MPEVTHRMRSWERSQRAVPWVPLLFPPHCSLVPVVPTGSSGAGDRKEQEEKESAGERQRLELPTWGSELEAIGKRTLGNLLWGRAGVSLP